MNIFNKVAFQSLVRSRTRTLVTIIGVALSAALFTGVAAFAVSLQHYMIQGAEGKYGGWHLEVFDTDAAFAAETAQDGRVSHVTDFEDIGYAVLDGGQNDGKPYLFIAGFHEETFSILPLNLLDGRLPENSGEVLVPAHVEANGGVSFSVGDTLTLSVGARQTAEGTLSQHDPLRAGEETMLPEAGKTYTVVGICQRPAFEPRTAPGYTLITMADPSAPTDSRTAFITMENPAQTGSFARKSLDGYAYTQNDSVLRFTGASSDPVLNTLIFSAGFVLLTLIMMGSVFMIYNAFNISLNERTHQFGILMSVGATERQLRNSVLFEGLCIGVVGIPLGILAAIPGVKVVLALVAENFANVMYASVPLELAVSVPSLIAAAAISMATILISAYIPAKRAASVPVMECIRQTNEIKVDPKSLRTPERMVQLCGLESALAMKNFKRNKGRYRSVILSLTFSVVLFVAASYFKVCLISISNQARIVTDFDISLSVKDVPGERLERLCEQMRTVSGVTHASCRILMECTGTVRSGGLSDAFWQTAGIQPSGETAETVATLLIVSDSFYRQLVEEQGLPAEEYAAPGGKLLAVGKMEANGYVEGPDDLEDMFTCPETTVTLTPWDSEGQKLAASTDVTIGLHTFVPPDAAGILGSITPVPYYFEILVPWSMLDTLRPEGAAIAGEGIAFRSDTPGQTTSLLKEIAAAAGLPSYTLLNMHQILEESRNILFIASLFTLVFTAMISLIAVANVFNTISTNIKLRRRELAMLRSVGMDDGGFARMMRFECALYGLRTLLYGLPLSLLASWLIYMGMTFKETDKFPFQFPWASLGISMLGVFLVIFITMLYATNRIRRENIIDALRDELT